MIIPIDKDKKGIVIEFKKVSKRENLEQAAESALKQIQDKKYRKQLLDRGINAGVFVVKILFYLHFHLRYFF